jgi:hypothetical protein
MNFPPSFFKEIKKAVAEKFKRDFNIKLSTTDRRRKGKLYRAN